MSDEDFTPFLRTQEQRAADAAQLEREIAAERAKDELRGGPPFVLKRESQSGDLGAALASIAARAETVEARRRSLPCYAAVQAKDDDGAIDACDAAGVDVDACEWSKNFAACPRLRAPDAYDGIVKRLSDGMVEDREVGVLLAAARRTKRVPLMQQLDALVFVKAALQRKRMSVAFQNAAEADAAGALRPQMALLTGTEAIIVMGGNQGRGKTLAACYAIAKMGGYYTRTPDWTRRGATAVDYDRALSAPVLVIDQLGREDWGSSDWHRSQFENVIDARYQSRRLTIIAGNVGWDAFVAHFDKHLNQSTLRDRIFGDGVFVIFGGESLRAGLRADLLAANSMVNQ